MTIYLITVFIVFVSGSLVGMYFRNRSEKLMVVRIKGNNHKMSSYRDIIRLMRTILYFDQYKNYWGSDWEYYANTEEVLYELKKEWAEMLFYAPSDILNCVQRFILNPDRASFEEAILLMRKDLNG